MIDFRVRLPFELRPLDQQDPPEVNRRQYDHVLGTEATRQRTFQDLLEDMEAADVNHAVIHAEYEFGDPADELNEAVAKIVRERPDRFSGFGTVSLEHFDVKRSLEQLQMVRELNLVGINIQPAFFGMAINDRRLYPLYATANEHGLLVAIHTGVNYSLKHSIVNEQPLMLDEIACDIQGIDLIACHAGWPWAGVMAAVARKHPNIYLDFGGLAPKYVFEPDAGWSPIGRLMRRQLRSQILFATDWPVFNMQRAISEWRDSPLPKDTQSALLSQNARQLLKLVENEDL